MLLVIALASCQQPSELEAELASYLKRLSRVLALDISRKQAPNFTAPPRVKITTKATRISLLDFTKLTGCQLQHTIGKKNSSLGRVAPASQQLMLELEFLQLAPACISQLENSNDTELAAKLRLAVATKTEQLPITVWQAILGSDEYAAFWRPTAPADYPNNTNDEPILALHYLSEQSSQWLNGNYQYDGAKIEQALFYIKQGDGGALLYSWRQLHLALRAVNSAIRTRLTQRPLCFDQQPNTQFERFNNVVKLNFIDKIQSRAATLESRRYQLIAATTALESVLSAAEPDTYQAWREQRDLRLASYATAPKTHVGYIQQLWQLCGHSH